ncbi:MAG: PadR family transcriptional regulator [Actinobacteria bacterium]|nr:PadR family transcriptional regulator [Actinomycetota bacterium]
MSQLTTTSYLILGMLSSRDWPAYELAEQVDKGLTEVWPRARRQLYNAPKQLAEQGLVSATKEATGRRKRTVYSITPAGRKALREWLATDPKRVSLEFEGMIHLLLADQGTIEDLRSTLESVREEALLSRAVFEGHMEYIRDTDGGTFPEKRHLFVLSSAFMIGHFAHLADWATWALGEIESWTDTQAPRPEA